MILRPRSVADILDESGETEASSAGAQLAEGYPGRVMTDNREGRASALPSTLSYPVIARPCLRRLAPEGRNPRGWTLHQCGHNFRRNVVKFSGTHRSKRLQRSRSEYVGRSFAHVCGTGGARRSWLRFAGWSMWASGM